MLKVLSQCVAGLLVATASGWAGEFRIESAGIRSGFHEPGGSDSFRQTEGFANWNLPWHWDLGRAWELRCRLDLTAGCLTGEGENGFVGTIGPSLVLEQGRFPLVLVGGVSPTVLSRDTFGSTDFGVPFQFTSHVGLRCHLGSHFDVGYRFQHMSNAHLSDHNPGLDLHMFTLGYRF